MLVSNQKKLYITYSAPSVRQKSVVFGPIGKVDIEEAGRHDENPYS